MGAAPAGGSKMGRNIGIGCLVLLLLSCVCSAASWGISLMSGTATYTPPAVGGVEPAVAPAAPAAPAAAAGGSVCQRAVDCCNAYAQTPYGASVASSCASYATPGMPDVGCQSAIDGFRAGLTATNQAVPPACQ